MIPMTSLKMISQFSKEGYFPYWVYGYGLYCFGRGQGSFNVNRENKLKTKYVISRQKRRMDTCNT